MKKILSQYSVTLPLHNDKASTTVLVISNNKVNTWLIAVRSKARSGKVHLCAEW